MHISLCELIIFMPLLRVAPLSSASTLWAARHALALQLFGQIEVAHLDPSISAVLARQLLTPNLGASPET